MSSRTIVKHDIPEHRCPVCNRTCVRYREGKKTGEPTGRKPVTRRKVIDYLQTHTSYRNPKSLEEVAQALDMSLNNVAVVIRRARQFEQAPIKHLTRGGYYWDDSE